ncbi:MAG: hypothetical protein M1820_002448 [Bogoriella megaspora]|nr:MAG: hypothetical protein M1820_002448 [Bogoriella megaspora]
MDMSSSSDSMSSSDSTMMMSAMPMVFSSGTGTALYTTQFTPNSTGAYAGACIFLVVLAVIFRGLFALKTYAEHHWRNQALARRYVSVAGKGTEAERIRDSTASKDAVISVNGVEEGVRIIQRRGSPIQPFRLTVDPVRALLMTAIATVGYLLMLAVMTLNYAYFLSILAGTFLGELALGRISQVASHE